LIVEVPNRDPPYSYIEDAIKKGILTDTPTAEYYWFAKVIQMNGYLFKMCYIGQEDDPSSYFWMHCADPTIRQVGESAEKNDNLIAPKSIVCDNDDWANHIRKDLLYKKTIPRVFKEQVKFVTSFQIK
jgi:hypothetical protein